MNPALVDILTDSALPKPALKLEHGGNTFTQLSSEQQSGVYEQLLMKRHSLEILKEQFHVIENERLPDRVTKIKRIKLVFGPGDFAAAPKGQSSTDSRKAVAIDCEWGEAKSNRRELLAICAIDALTGETLMKSLVSPSQPMKKWRDKVHGITQAKINAALKSKQCLRGWKEARTKLFEHIDGQTILIGNSTRLHLDLLRLFHTTIVDSEILVTYAVFNKKTKRPRPQWPVLRVRKDFLGMPIQQNAIHESGTESVYENALVSREIVLQCIQRPKHLRNWANEWRIEFWQPHNEKNQAKEKRDMDEAKKDTNEAEKEEKAKTGDSDARPDVETTVGPISDKKQTAGTFTEGFEAGYLAGLQKGLENGLKQANSQENKAMEDILYQPPSEREYTCQKSIQHIDGEESFGDHGGLISQNDSNNDDWAPA